MSGAQANLAVKVDQGPKTMVLAADNRDRKRQSKSAGPNKRARRASNTEPNWQRILERPRVNSLASQRGAMFTCPVDVRLLANLEKQIELLGKKRIVIVEIEAKERKCLDKGAAPGHNFGPAIRNEVEGREFLKDTDRVGSAQDRDRTC